MWSTVFSKAYEAVAGKILGMHLSEQSDSDQLKFLKEFTLGLSIPKTFPKYTSQVVILARRFDPETRAFIIFT